MSCMQMCHDAHMGHFSRSFAAGVARFKNYVVGISRRQLSGLDFGRLS